MDHGGDPKDGRSDGDLPLLRICSFVRGSCYPISSHPPDIKHKLFLSPNTCFDPDWGV